MKKTLILASLMAFTMSTALANPQTPAPETNRPPMAHGKFQPPPKPSPEQMAKKRAEFEAKLNLTEEQKAKAKEIRMKGHEAMKPIMEQIKAKKQEIQTVKLSRIAVEDQEQKIAQLNEEIKALKKQAKELRIKNTQEFEAILTPQQKKTLEKMKKEGKENFKKHHPKRALYNKGCNCPPNCNCKK